MKNGSKYSIERSNFNLFFYIWSDIAWSDAKSSIRKINLQKLFCLLNIIFSKKFQVKNFFLKNVTQLAVDALQKWQDSLLNSKLKTLPKKPTFHLA